MRSAMAYRPAMGFLAHSLVHSVFGLSELCFSRPFCYFVCPDVPFYPHVSWNPRNFCVRPSVLVEERRRRFDESL